MVSWHLLSGLLDFHIGTLAMADGQNLYFVADRTIENSYIAISIAQILLKRKRLLTVVS